MLREWFPQHALRYHRGYDLKEALAKLESMGLLAALMGGGQHVLEAVAMRLLNTA